MASSHIKFIIRSKWPIASKLFFKQKNLSSSNSCYQFHHQLHDQILYYPPMFFKFIIKNSLLPNVFHIHHTKILYYPPMFFKFIIKIFKFTKKIQIHHQKFFFFQCFSNSSLNPWSEFWWSISFNYYLSSDFKNKIKFNTIFFEGELLPPFVSW